MEIALSCSEMYGMIPTTAITRHEAAEHGALAVARGDEVGDEVMRFTLLMRMILRSTSHQTTNGERRPEVDRQETDARSTRRGRRAVERPGRAVDGDREGVDVGVGDEAAPCVGALVAVVGDGEQQAEIKKETLMMTGR